MDHDAVAFPARLPGRSSPASSLPMSNAATLSDQGSGMRILQRSSMILSSLPSQMATQLFAYAFKRAAKAGEALFLRSEDDPHGSQEPRRHTHWTTLEGIPSASRAYSARACQRRPGNAGANQPL